MPPPDLVGKTLNAKWTIDAFLGEGGVASVFAGTHRNGKRVAVKVLHPELARVAEVRERFLREGYLANRVDHPGAVSVLDDDTTEDGLVFIVMELLRGESLDRTLERRGGGLPVEQVLSIADQMLDVLEAAHAKGIVHRDVKPENVFLLPDGRIKLLDFGIARLHEPTSKSATQSGAAMGTPSFMPPEQARGRWELVDARSDLWAVGAAMYTLLSARYVHEGGTVAETLLAAMTQRVPPVAGSLPGTPKAVCDVIDRALAFDREDRWPDAASMRAALGPLLPRTEPRARAPAASELQARPAVQSRPDAATRGDTAGPRPPTGTVLVGARSLPRPTAPPRRGVLIAIAGAAVAAGAVILVLVTRSAGPAPKAAAAVTARASAAAIAPTSTAPIAAATAPPAEPASAAGAANAVPTEPAPEAAASVTRLVTPAELPIARPASVAPATTTAPTAARAAPAPTHPSSNPLDRRH